MESYPVQFLLTPGERQATHAILATRLESFADTAEDPFTSAMYRDATGVYETANPVSAEGMAMNRRLVEHAVRIDDPDTVALALPLVHPLYRSKLVAQAAVSRAQHPSRFTNITDEHVQGWWHGIRSTDVYAVADLYGATMGTRTMLAIVNAWFAIEVATAKGEEQKHRAYDMARENFFRNIDMARAGRLFNVAVGSPSRSELQYEAELTDFTHLAGSVGMWEPAERLGKLDLAYLYRAGAGMLEPGHILQLLEHGANADNLPYYELLAKIALVTHNQRKRDMGLGPIEHGDFGSPEDWLHDTAGTADLPPVQISYFLERAGRALQIVNPELHNLLLSRIPTHNHVLNVPHDIDNLRAVGGIDVPRIMSDFYTHKLKENDDVVAFWTALYFASAKPGEGLEPSRTAQVERLLGEAANLDAWLDVQLGNEIPVDDLRAACMALAHTLSELGNVGFHDMADVVAANVSIAGSMQRHKLLRNEDGASIVKRTRPLLVTLRARKSQIYAVNNIQDTIAELTKDSTGKPIEYLVDLSLQRSKGLVAVSTTGSYL